MCEKTRSKADTAPCTNAPSIQPFADDSDREFLRNSKGGNAPMEMHINIPEAGQRRGSPMTVDGPGRPLSQMANKGGLIRGLQHILYEEPTWGWIGVPDTHYDGDVDSAWDWGPEDDWEDAMERIDGVDNEGKPESPAAVSTPPTSRLSTPEQFDHDPSFPCIMGGEALFGETGYSVEAVAKALLQVGSLDGVGVGVGLASTLCAGRGMPSELSRPPSLALEEGAPTSSVLSGSQAWVGSAGAGAAQVSGKSTNKKRKRSAGQGEGSGDDCPRAKKVARER